MFLLMKRSSFARPCHFDLTLKGSLPIRKLPYQVSYKPMPSISEHWQTPGYLGRDHLDTAEHTAIRSQIAAQYAVFRIWDWLSSHIREPLAQLYSSHRVHILLRR